MAIDRLGGIVRARRIKAAVTAKYWAENSLVSADQNEADVSHDAGSGSGSRPLRSGSPLDGTEGGGMEFLSTASSSRCSEANSARATDARGCTMMSHPDGISSRSSRRISRTRLRMRLRTTAPPSPRPTLIPKRLTPRPFAAKNTVNWRLERRKPWRYTASNSARRVRRPRRRASSCPLRGLESELEAAEGPDGRPLDAREFVPSFPAARRKNFPPAFGLHPRAKAVGLVTAAHLGLKRTLRQTRFSSTGFGAATPQSAPEDVCETPSVNGV